MKIPHRELERFRRDPQGWLIRRRQAPPFKGMRYWNESALRAAVHWLHKGYTLEEAAAKLAYLARKDPDLDGRHEAMQRLAAYEHWRRLSGRATTHVKLQLPAWDDYSSLGLGGSVDRVDVLAEAPQPVQAIYLGRHTGHWREELRMPLTQHALASSLGWPVEEVAVGVQLIDGSEPDVHHYPLDEIAEAVKEFSELEREVRDLL